MYGWRGRIGLMVPTGEPVVSANQATFADCLRILGVRNPRPGFGSLFERVLSRDTAEGAPQPTLVRARASG